MKSISVIIPYYGSDLVTMRNHIISCIQSSYTPKEIIIINDGHTTDLSSFCYEFSEQITMIYAIVQQDKPWNVSECMNIGVWLSNSDYLSIEDCDILPEKEYYKTAIKKLNKGFGKFTAHYLNADEHPTACGVYSRKMLTDLIGWDEDFSGHYGYDDILLNAKIDIQGYRTFLSKEKLISSILSGRTFDADRDNTHNQQLMLSKLEDYRRNRTINTNILRLPFKVERYECK